MQRQQNNKKVLLITSVVTMAMFGFGFALVPLYEVFCQITGLNGKTGGRYEPENLSTQVDYERQVKVQFLTQTNAQMAWDFRPQQQQVVVRPGESTVVYFYAHNRTDKKMTVQAVPSVTPFAGAEYFHKTECFCFTRQSLEANEEVLMPLQFIVSKDLPMELRTLTLSYTLFDQTEAAQNNAS